MNLHGIRVAIGYEAGLAPMSGISRYTRELCAGLAAHPEIRDVRRIAHNRWLDGRDGATSAGPVKRSSEASFVKAAAAGALRRVYSALQPGLSIVEPVARLVQERGMKRLLQPGTADIYHEPNYVLRESSLPAVVSVHDLSIFIYPQYHPTERVAHLSREIPRALERSDRIITLSQLVKRQIVEMFGVGPDKIAVVPIGINSIFHVRSEAECMQVLADLGVMWKRYLLFVGTLEPRKNLERVIKSLRLVPPGLLRRVPLVIVGGGGWSNDDLKSEIERAQAAGLVKYLGAVGDDQLAVLYAAARGLVFISHYEGQGLPGIEAAASGTPVLISENSAMTEQVGAIALSSPAEDERAIADGIRALIEDDQLQQRAYAEAEGFRSRCGMQRCVDQTVAIYKAVLEAR